MVFKAMVSALEGYTGPVTTWANEMKFGMNHAPGAGFITGRCTITVHRTVGY